MSTSPPSPAPPPSFASFRRKAIPYLTVVSHVSTPFISAFLLVHLSAPVLANIGGSSLSSQVMLLGREYYQTPLGEPLLLCAPLGLHIAAGLLKRLCAPQPLRLRTPGRTPALSAAAAGALALLPLHALVHRVHPAHAAHPVAALGPGELDFEFVKFGLQTWPVRSGALLGALVACVLLHAAEGVGVLWRRWGRDAERGSTGRRRRRRRVLAGAGAAVVLSGVWAIAREPMMAFSSLQLRFAAAYRRSIVYVW